MSRRSNQALVAEGISVHFGDKEVVSSATFRAAPGELTLLTGRSGAGKSTVLHTIAGLIKPNGGSVTLGGLDLVSHGNDVRRRVGIVYQDPMLLTDLTVEENVRWVARLRGLGNAEAAQHARRAIAAVGLEELLDRKVHHLSGGEAQRVSIARACVAGPWLIVADEPTSALDSSNSETVAALLRQLAADMGIPVIAASHDPILVRHAHSVIELSDGRATVPPGAEHAPAQ